MWSLFDVYLLQIYDTLKYEVLFLLFYSHIFATFCNFSRNFILPP